MEGGLWNTSSYWNYPSVSGIGGIIYLSSANYISFSANIGPATNNSAELFALKQLIQHVKEQGITSLHIYRDFWLL
jgi:ribonuclease HI